MPEPSRPVWPITRQVLTDAARDALAAWRSLALTGLAYKAVAFAILAPASGMLLRWLRSGHGVLADVDVAWFFLTTPAGLISLVSGGSLLVAIAALEAACLMATGLAAAKGTRLRTREALALGAANAVSVLRLAWRVLVRVAALSLPFLAAMGVVYLALLRSHDINYYLAQRPPELWTALGLVALLGAALAWLLVRLLARWVLALPLVLFESVGPRQALADSAARSLGDRRIIVAALLVWGAASLALSTITAAAVGLAGRAVAPSFAHSLPLLLSFVAVLTIVWTIVSLATAVASSALLATLIVRIYLRLGEPREPRLPAASEGRAALLSPRIFAAAAAVALLGAAGLAVLALLRTQRNEPVLVIGHRGCRAAPENTLTAFRAAAEAGADYVELDVQESKDGEVVVVHDSDLMKVGGAALKIWETDAAGLRSIDVGSRAGVRFAAERVPTLAEALALCKGRCRVVVELKSYGHAQRLEDRVVAIVEASAMADSCIFMSLDHAMVRRLKEIRPAWRCGILVAKALGDLTALPADFFAVEVRVATAEFVRRAHALGKPVYVWTVNDAAWMLTALGNGVDGLITDEPGLAREVVTRRAALSDAQRLLVALLVRLGASVQTLAAEDALRP